jgi:plasmid stabilization system protein ParE
MGRPGLVGRPRELVAKPSIVVSKVAEEDDEIVVLGIVHGAQDR